MVKRGKYSARLNPEAEYCAGVGRGQIMKKDHGLGNYLEKLLGAPFLKKLHLAKGLLGFPERPNPFCCYRPVVLLSSNGN